MLPAKNQITHSMCMETSGCNAS